MFTVRCKYIKILVDFSKIYKNLQVYKLLSISCKQLSLHLSAFQLAVFDGYAVRCSFLCLECKFFVSVEDVARCAAVRLYYCFNELAILPCDVNFKASFCAKLFLVLLYCYRI